MANWYVIQTKTRQEAITERNLTNQCYKTFLPMLRVRRYFRGKLQYLSEPLFPGYLFVQLDIEKQNTAPIRSTRGAIGLVRLGATLQPFPDMQMDALMSAQTLNGDVIDASNMLKRNDRVRILNGPLDGIEAVFKAQNSQERVILLLNILGSETLVSMSSHQIAKVG